MADEIVLYETRYPAALITLNNPAHRNALSAPMIDALMSAIDRAEQDPRVRALIFTGAAPAFSAGMDLAELRAIIDSLRVDEAGAVWDGALRGEELIERVYRLGKPTIAAVNGVAVGNGAGFLSACDMAVASADARIGYTEMKHGIQAGMVILHLMRLVGERVARYLLLTGELVTAEKARGLGLINEVVPADQVVATAIQWAGMIASNAPKAEAITKSLMCRFSGQAIAMSMTEYTAAPHITDECRAGLAAFFDKKPVPWSVQ
ncbi:MAG TPA: enoyl-CoA hydratase/isomerase family protein [Candidatus Acidoferrales bacterium]|nr:enoyl-CoA hydratase/isomerase family protein [Candidatus Acidoferrales bacterium]